MISPVIFIEVDTLESLPLAVIKSYRPYTALAPANIEPTTLAVVSMLKSSFTGFISTDETFTYCPSKKD